MTAGGNSVRNHPQLVAESGWLADQLSSGRASLRGSGSQDAETAEVVSFGRGLANGLFASSLLWLVLIATIIL